MENCLYWSSVEYKYDKEHLDYNQLDGGFVYLFLYTQDVRSFLCAMEKEFKTRKLTIIKVEFIKEYDLNTKWDDKEDERKFKRIIKEAKAIKMMVFDDFYAYERQVI